MKSKNTAAKLNGLTDM